MSALPEVSSHIADIGRQLNCPGVGCIIKKNKDGDLFYLELVFLTQQVWRNCNIHTFYMTECKVLCLLHVLKKFPSQTSR